MKPAMRLRPAPALVVLALLGAGCGGGETRQETTTPVEDTRPPPPAAPVSARGADAVTARVGSRGGTLELSNGTRLSIPDGALASEVEITLRVAADGQAFEDRETRRPLSAVVEIVPSLTATSGHEFTVSMPAQPIPDGFDRSDLALAHETDDTRGRPIGSGTHTRWDMWPARIDGDRFAADLGIIEGHRLQFGVSR